MNEELLSRLYHEDPAIRLAAANDLDPGSQQEILEECKPWLPNVYGSANAWVLAVGPSPDYNGGGPKAPIDHSHPLVLGEVMLKFRTFREEKWAVVFHEELFRLIRAGFAATHLLLRDPDAHLKLMLQMNLDTTPKEHESNTPAEKLRQGVHDRLLPIIEKTRPRIILTLTETVYDLIVDELGRKHSCSVSDPDPHRVEAGPRTYTPESRWIARPDLGTFLLAQLAQHPSRVNTYAPYKRAFSAYVRRRFRDALAEAPLCKKMKTAA